MATDQLMAPIPSIQLEPGMVIKWEAISPTTGAAVANVKVSAIAVAGIPGGEAGAPTDGLQAGPFMLVPGPGEGA